MKRSFPSNYNKRPMKTFEVKFTEINEGGKFLSNLDLTRVCVAAPGVQGLTIDDLRKRTKILDLIEEQSKLEGTEAHKFDISDEQSQIIMTCVQGMKWNLVSKDLVTFVDDLEKMFA